MIAFITSFFATLGVVFKRLWHNLGVSISSLAGVVVVLSLVICVPVFSYAISGRVLIQQLTEKASNTNRRLFSLHMYALENTTNSTLTLDKVREVSNHINARVGDLMGARVERITVEIQTGAQKLLPPG